MKILIKKKLAALIITAALLLVQIPVLPALAATPGSVVINEVAWSGSATSANDEWIELYNTTNQPVDLSGWKILDDVSASIYQLNGTIAAHGYYVIEDSESTVSTLTASAIINLSLANSGDSLQLVGNANQAIDTVDGAGGMWAAGDAGTHASMERVNALASGDDPLNWKTSTGAGSTAKDSGNAPIIGTPGIINSANGNVGGGNGGIGQTTVSLQPSSQTPQVGDTVDVTINITGAQNLFSYGFEIGYDPSVFSYESATKGSFLSQNNTITTSFQQGKQNGQEGTLLLAEAITNLPKTGRNGDGILCTFTLNVIGQSANQSTLTFKPSSFIANQNSDISATFTNVNVTPATITGSVQNLQIVQAASRYALQLSWTAPSSGATGYKIYRKDPEDTWKLLGDSPNTNFIDEDTVTAGGKIVPLHTYNYRVVAVKNNVESQPLEGSGQETRGLKGDNNRSDQVDGRDLENLAQHFGEDLSGLTFDALIDTTYDGVIDGSDLIDLGANFALTYS